MPLANFPYGISSMGLPLTGAVNPFGDVWFVAASGGSDGINTSQNSITRPYATIAKAIAVGVAGDTIILGRGTHSVDVSAAALVPLADMQFVAAISPLGGKPATIITHDADDGADLITIDVDGVGFHGIEFLFVAGGTTAVRTVAVSQTTAVSGLIFRDCWFNQNSVDATTVISIAVDDASNATTGMVIQGCRFIGGDATTGQAIYINVGVPGIPAALIENNVFELESADNDARAFIFGDPTATTGSYAMVIRNNDFIGPKDGGVDCAPIEFNASMTEDEIVCMIRTNYFGGCTASAITVDKINSSIVWNYGGHTTAGGALIDPGT